MSTKVYLEINHHNEVARSLLMLCPFMKNLDPEYDFNGLDVYAVNSVVYNETFNETQKLSSMDLNFLQNYEAQSIFMPEQIHTDIIPGHNLNYNFIKFVKFCAVKSKSALSVVYKEERGDWWKFTLKWDFLYIPENSENIEILKAQEADYEDPAERYSGSISLKYDGTIESTPMSKNSYENDH